MKKPPFKETAVAQALTEYRRLLAEGRGERAAAAEVGIPRTTLRRWAEGTRDINAELDIDQPPERKDEPIAELIARKKAQFQRQETYEQWAKLVKVKVKDSGPVVVAAIGDPHLDNDGCDIGQVERDMTVIGRTKGMYALHVGDITDNWVGNLGRLYAHSSTKAKDGMRLAEWMFELAPPIAVVGGNHDCWNNGMDWLGFCLSQADHNPMLEAHGVRLSLEFPGAPSLRVHTRHDFPGHSQYNPLHGLRKEHLFGQRDHINIAGHKHIDSAAVVPSPDGFCQWMFRVSGYKTHDDYAKQGNFPEMKMSPAVALLIQPKARLAAELVKPYWDMEAAADYLGFIRRREGL